MKRKTKAQREQEQRAALLRRVTDIYSGAQGAVWDNDDFVTAEILGQVIPVLRELFGTENTEYLFSLHCLRYFDSAASATNHLFSNGVRA